MNLHKKIEGEIPSIIMGDYTLQLEMEYGDEYQEKARLELRETPEVVEDAVEKLRKMIKDESGLLVPSRDDFYITFLRPCKFYADSAFKKVKSYYTFKLKNKTLCDNLIPSVEGNVFEQDLLTILPKRDKDGRRILLIEAGKKWDTKKCSVVEILRGIMLILEVALVEPRTQICGAVVIFDLIGLSMQHVWQITPSFAANVAQWVQECIPIRLKAIHIVNQPYIFNMLFAIFKPFLAQKLRNRIHFHGTKWQNLHQHIGPEFLPQQFGGEMDIPSYTGVKLHELMCAFEEEFTIWKGYGYENGLEASCG